MHLYQIFYSFSLLWLSILSLFLFDFWLQLFFKSIVVHVKKFIHFLWSTMRIIPNEFLRLVELLSFLNMFLLWLRCEGKHWTQKMSLQSRILTHFIKGIILKLLNSFNKFYLIEYSLNAQNQIFSKHHWLPSKDQSRRSVSATIFKGEWKILKYKRKQK